MTISHHALAVLISRLLVQNTQNIFWLYAKNKTQHGSKFKYSSTKEISKKCKIKLQYKNFALLHKGHRYGKIITVLSRALLYHGISMNKNCHVIRSSWLVSESEVRKTFWLWILSSHFYVHVDRERATRLIQPGATQMDGWNLPGIIFGQISTDSEQLVPLLITLGLEGQESQHQGKTG